MTQGQFAEFIRDTGHSMSGGCKVWTGSEWKLDPDLDWRNPGFDQTESHPVTCVSWHDANAYAAWLSDKTGKEYRLLTEAEWEYAARAGSHADYPWGNDAPTCETGRSNSARTTTDESCSGYGTMDVGSFAPNAFGLFDTVGNLWEWTEDCSHDYESAPSGGGAWTEEDCAYRIIRGGTWSAPGERSTLRRSLRIRRHLPGISDRLPRRPRSSLVVAWIGIGQSTRKLRSMSAVNACFAASRSPRAQRVDDFLVVAVLGDGRDVRMLADQVQIGAVLQPQRLDQRQKNGRTVGPVEREVEVVILVWSIWPTARTAGRADDLFQPVDERGVDPVHGQLDDQRFQCQTGPFQVQHAVPD